MEAIVKQETLIGLLKVNQKTIRTSIEKVIELGTRKWKGCLSIFETLQEEGTSSSHL